VRDQLLRFNRAFVAMVPFAVPLTWFGSRRVALLVEDTNAYGTKLCAAALRDGAPLGQLLSERGEELDAGR
jgi:hypothetical protein